MKKETITSVFSELCEKYLFKRDKSSAIRKFDYFDVYINLQKSRSGKYFYINVIILYPELMDSKIDFNSTEIFGLKAPFFPHVAFRIECLAAGDGVNQNLFDDLFMNKDWVGLRKALEVCFEKLIRLSESGEFYRSNIRISMKNGLISATARKDV